MLRTVILAIALLIPSSAQATDSFLGLRLGEFRRSVERKVDTCRLKWENPHLKAYTVTGVPMPYHLDSERLRFFTVVVDAETTRVVRIAQQILYRKNDANGRAGINAFNRTVDILRRKYLVKHQVTGTDLPVPRYYGQGDVLLHAAFRAQEDGVYDVALRGETRRSGMLEVVLSSAKYYEILRIRDRELAEDAEDIF